MAADFFFIFRTALTIAIFHTSLPALIYSELFLLWRFFKNYIVLMRESSFNMLNFLMKLKSPLKYACLHLTFLPWAGPLPVNKRKGLANYHRQSRTAAEPSWEEFPSLSQAGTVAGQGGWAVAKSFCSHCLTQWITWVGGGRRDSALCMGSSSTERTLGWEELLQLPVFC